MSFNREKMDLVADEFRFFPCNVANLLARHQHEYDAATTDEERGAALRRWRDEIESVKEFVLGTLDSYNRTAEDAQDDPELAEERARRHHGLTIAELQEAFEDENMNPAAPEQFAVIVFTEASFRVPCMSVEERSYRVSSKCKGFDPIGAGDELIGVCITGEEAPIRLDMFMRGMCWGYEAHDVERWKVDYCYRLDADGHRIREDFERSHD